MSWWSHKQAANSETNMGGLNIESPYSPICKPGCLFKVKWWQMYYVTWKWCPSPVRYFPHCHHILLQVMYDVQLHILCACPWSDLCQCWCQDNGWPCATDAGAAEPGHEVQVRNERCGALWRTQHLHVHLCQMHTYSTYVRRLNWPICVYVVITYLATQTLLTAMAASVVL